MSPVGTDERVALEALERLLLTDDPRHLEDLATLLCCFRELVVPLLAEALDADCEGIRSAAVWTLARIGGPRARAHLESIAVDAGQLPEIRDLAALALKVPAGELPHPRAPREASA
jgi:hypothetical protein